MTASVVVTESFAELLSGEEVPAVAVIASVPAVPAAASGRTTTVTVALPPDGIVPSAQLSVPEQVPWLVVNDCIAPEAGIASARVTALADDGPAFVTV